jgi:hypothetical protein
MTLKEQINNNVGTIVNITVWNQVHMAAWGDVRSDVWSNIEHIPGEVWQTVGSNIRENIKRFAEKKIV